MNVPFRILLTDDDEQDQELFREALIETGIHAELFTAINGQELIKRLNTFSSQNSELPDIIFLDLNMPVVDGKETLLMLKSHKVFSSIPVIMYSTSNSALEAREYYSKGANVFITKPCDFNSIVNIIKITHTLFKNHAVLPAKHTPGRA